jgi:uncharacterized protein (UPF0297 family)
MKEFDKEVCKIIEFTTDGTVVVNTQKLPGAKQVKEAVLKEVYESLHEKDKDVFKNLLIKNDIGFPF